MEPTEKTPPAERTTPRPGIAYGSKSVTVYFPGREPYIIRDRDVWLHFLHELLYADVIWDMELAEEKKNNGKAPRQS